MPGPDRGLLFESSVDAAEPDAPERRASLWRGPALVAAALLAVSCIEDGAADLLLPRPLRVPSIAVEITDVQGRPVVGAPVRIVAAAHEWSGRTVSSPNLSLHRTDADGRVEITPFDLAEAEVGFALDVDGRAVLSGRGDEDEALVELEVAEAVGVTPSVVPVELTYDRPRAVIGLRVR